MKRERRQKGKGDEKKVRQKEKGQNRKIDERKEDVTEGGRMKSEM